MVRTALTAIALLAACGAVVAAPAASADATAATLSFSFAQWVEDIIANPQGEHLTPEQAVAAFLAARNSTDGSEHNPPRPLEKRYQCNEQPGTECWAADAAASINALAQLGSYPCTARPNLSGTTFWLYNTAWISGWSVNGQTTACGSVARSGGIIMDKCTRGDGWVQGSENAWLTYDMLVRIANKDSRGPNQG